MANKSTLRNIDSIQANDKGLIIDNPYFLKLPTGSNSNRPDLSSTIIPVSTNGMIRYNEETGNIELFLPEVNSVGVPTTAQVWTSLGLGTDPESPGQGDFLQRFGGVMYGDLRMSTGDDFADSAGTLLGTSAKGTGLRAGIQSDSTNSRILNSTGSSGNPSYAFDVDRDTGFFLSDTNEMTFVAGGIPQLVINTSGATISAPTTMDDGVESAPGLAFDLDPNTGFYRSANDTMGLTAGGFEALEITITGPASSRSDTQVTIRGDLIVQGTTTTVDSENLVVTDNIIKLNNGESGAGVTLGASGIVVDRGSETDAGWLYDETNDWWGPTGPSGISGEGGATNIIGNIQEIDARTASVSGVLLANTNSIQIKNSGGGGTSHGTIAEPAYSFEADEDTGIYHPALEQIGFGTGGIEMIVIDGSDSNDQHTLFSRQTRTIKQPSVPSLSVTSIPSWSFDGDSDTGIGSTNADELELIVGGEVAMTLVSDGISGQLLIDDGNASTPTLAFKSDPDTGIFLNTSGNVGFTSGGTLMVNMNAGQSAFQSGSVANPGVAFLTDSDTGMFRKAADTLAFSTGGTERLVISSTGNTSFGSGNVEISAGDLTVSNTSPTVVIDDTDGTKSGVMHPAISFRGTGTQVGFVGYNSSTGVMQMFNNGGDLLIEADKDNSDASSKIDFSVDGTIRATIDSSGNVGVGTESTGARLEVNADNGETLRLSTAINAGVQQEWSLGFAPVGHTNPGASISALEFDVSDSRTSLLLYTRGTNSDVAPTERMRIDSDGNVGVGEDDPSSRLHVTGSGAKITIENQNGTQWSLGQAVVIDEFTIRDETVGQNRLHISATGAVTTQGPNIISSTNDNKLVMTGAANPRIDFVPTSGDEYFIDFVSGGLRVRNHTDLRTEMQFDGGGNVLIPDLTATTADINAGTIDNTVIGGSTPAAATITTLIASGLTYPTSDGSANQVLKTDGAGTLSFASAGGSGDALTTDPLSQFAATTSAELAGIISDETGTGALVFAASPTLSGTVNTSGTHVITSATNTKLTLTGSASPRLLFTSSTSDQYGLDIVSGLRIQNFTDTRTEMLFDGTGNVLIPDLTATIANIGGVDYPTVDGTVGQVIVTDGAGTLSFVDPSSLGMTNPMTTAEDIIVGGTGGDPERLAVGTEGQVLTVSSGAVAWVNPSGGGGGGMVPIERKTGADTSYDFVTGIDSTFRSYVLKGWLRPATDNKQLVMQTSSNTGSSFDATTNDYRYGLPGMLGTSALDQGATNQPFIVIAGGAAGPNAIGGAADERAIFAIEFEDPSNSAFKQHFRISGTSTTSDGVLHTHNGGGMRNAAGLIDALRLLFTTGNIADGDVTLYGIDNG